MRTKPKTISIDRLAHALGMHGVKLKRDHLITTSAYAYGYRNRETFAEAADAGELTAPAAVDLGRVDTPGGDALIVLRDPRNDRAYAIEEGFLSEIEGQRRERYGVSPYGNLLDLSGIVPDRGATDAPKRPRAAAQVGGAAIYIAIITANTHDRDVISSGSWNDLLRRIERHCRACWHPGFEREAPEGALDTVEAYFDMVGEHASMEIFVDHGVDAAEAVGSGDIREIDALLRGLAETQTVSANPRSGEGDAFVIGAVGDGSGEPMTWWSNEAGFGSLSEATVFGDMVSSLPTAGMPAGSVGWYQLPGGREAAPEAGSGGGAPRPSAANLDIDFITNREAEGGGDEIDHLRPYLRAEECDTGDRSGMTVSLGYLAAVKGLAPGRRGGTDEEMFFAPTIRAWHDGSHADAVGAIDAVSGERERLEPLIVRLGGFCMTEEDEQEGKVEMTAFIPANVANGVDPQDWAAAIDYLLGLGGERIMADFTPQASVLDNCIDVDPLGETKFDVTFEVLLMGEEAAGDLQDHDADHLTDAIAAPDWIREWPGPFSVHVADAIARGRA